MIIVKKKFINICLTILLILTNIFTVSAFANDIEVKDKIQVKGAGVDALNGGATWQMQGSDISTPTIQYKGDSGNTSVHSLSSDITRANGDASTFGYCITAFGANAEMVGGYTAQSVDVSELSPVENQLGAILVNGYPNCMLDMDTYGLSEDDMKYATDIASKHFQFQHPDDFPQYTSGTALGGGEPVIFTTDNFSKYWIANDETESKILKLAEDIYNAGMAMGNQVVDKTLEIKSTDINGELLNPTIQYKENSTFKIDMKFELSNGNTFTQGKILPDLTQIPNVKIYINGEEKSITTDEIVGLETTHLNNGKGVIFSYGDAITLEIPENEGLTLLGNNDEVDLSNIYSVITNGEGVTCALKFVPDTSNESYQKYMIVTQYNNTFYGDLKLTKTTDEILGGLSIEKKDAGSGKNIDGAMFRVKGISLKNEEIDLNVIASSTGNEDLNNGVIANYSTGKIVLENLPTGDYEVTEISPPEGYELSTNNVQTATVSDISIEPVLLTYANNPIITPNGGGFTLTKYDAFTKEILDGAEFLIEGIDNNNIKVELLMTGSYTQEISTDSPPAIATVNGGYIEFENMPAGKYKVTEVLPPTYYSIQEDPDVIVEVTDTTSPAIDFYNDSWTKLKLNKLDYLSGKGIAGAVLNIRNDEIGYSKDFTTDSTGSFITEPLDSGTYIVTEIQAPEGYQKSDIEMKVVINHNQGEIERTFINESDGNIIIEKYDGDTNELIDKPAEFSIKSMDDASVNISTVTENGIISSEKIESLYGDGLPNGWYVIDELEAPDGYEKASCAQQVYIEKGITQVIKFDNYRLPDLELIKIDSETGDKLEGAVFRITKSDGTSVGDFTTDENGSIFIENLEPDVYTITEIKAPNGYMLDAEPFNVRLELSEDIDLDKSKVITFENTKKPVLVVTKYDEKTGELLPGAQFKIEGIDDSGNSINWTGYLTEGEVFEQIQGYDVVGEITDGKIIISGLPTGTYTVTEINPPNGYTYSDTTPYIQTVVLETGDTKTLKFDNLPLPDLEILKVDDEDSSKVLEGAVFELSKADGEVVRTDTTDENGKILWENLEPDVYTLTEISPPIGYEIAMEPRQIRLDIGKDIEELTTIIVENKLKPEIVISKIDSVTKENISGVTYELSYQNGDVISEYTTDENGQIIIAEMLPEGYYDLKEVDCPDNYILDEEVHTIYIKSYEDNIFQFENTKKPTLVINKLSGLTGYGLEGAMFKIEYRGDGTYQSLGTYTSNENGQIIVPFIQTGWYRVTEIKAPEGFKLPDDPAYEIYLGEGDNSYDEIIMPDISDNSDIEVSNGSDLDEDITGEITFNGTVISSSGYDYLKNTSLNGTVLNNNDMPIINYPLDSLVIKKIDGNDGTLLEGAVFEVIQVAEGISGSNGTTIGRYTTDYSGIIVITGLEAGNYIVKEVEAPDNYTLKENSTQNAYLSPDDTSIVELTFSNYPYSSLLISKYDSLTKEPLSGVKFRVETSNGTVVGETNGIFTTDVNGEILIPNVEPDSYVVTEIETIDGYVLNANPETIDVGADGQIYHLEFENSPLGELIINKFENDTKEPLANATFKVTNSEGNPVGTTNGIFETDETGTIKISNLPKDTYTVIETKAPDGYILSDETKSILVDYGETFTLDFYNTPKSSVQIVKIDSETKEPLKDAEFTLYKSNGEVVGVYETDVDGLIIIDDLDNGWYKCVETKAPDGYIIDDTPKDFEVNGDEFHKLVFTNNKKTGIIIRKLDEDTKEPLANAVFEVEKQNGERVGEFTTNENGLINISTLEPDIYIVSEVEAPDGYILDEVPKTVEVKTNTPTEVTFYNKKLSGLTIIKLDSETREPLEDAEFQLEKLNGERVGYYTTSSTGKINIDSLDTGTYILTEMKAPDGYTYDPEPMYIEITWGEAKTVEVLNDPNPMLVIEKTIKGEDEPLAGVEFLVTKLNGQTGSMYGQLATPTTSQIGYYTTDTDGKIYIDNLEEGTYIIKETKVPEGFEIDNNSKEVEILSGERTIVRFENARLSSILLRKIDSVTKEGIYGVEFLLYDEDNNPIGQFQSDDQGYVHIDRELEDGKYYIRELEPADGYARDDTPRTIYVQEGRTTQITWENRPIKGQIIVTKRSIDYNEVTKLPAGSTLSGATFEVYNTTGNLVDKFTTDERGVGGSTLLPLGVYFVKETNPPKYYAINTREFWVELKNDGDVVRLEVLDESINLGVSIQKSGQSNIETGKNMFYKIDNIANNSDVALENFYIHDRIPTDATRVLKVMTGTYNERVTYALTYKTNYNSDYTLLADNLLSSNDYEYSLHSNVLGLRNGEYVTDVRLEFGTVQSGFANIKPMMLEVNVMPTIPDGYTITNKADVGGRYYSEWESAISSWVTKVIGNVLPSTTLPRTGY